jgi:hypothetical protein
LSLTSSILLLQQINKIKHSRQKEKIIMAVVKVSGKVSKVFGASNQGLSLVESYKSATGEDYTRTYTVWFAVAHGVAEGSEVTVFGQLSTKIEDYEDRNGQAARKVKLDINNAQIAVEAPAVVAPVAASNAPF